MSAKVRELLKEALALLDEVEDETPVKKPDELQYIGFIANPTLSTPKGKNLYKAGLKITTNGNSEFVNFQVWGDLALWCHNNLARGQKAHIRGVFKTQSWTDQNGQFQTKEVFSATKVEAL